MVMQAPRAEPTLKGEKNNSSLSTQVSQLTASSLPLSGPVGFAVPFNGCGN